MEETEIIDLEAVKEEKAKKENQQKGKDQKEQKEKKANKKFAVVVGGMGCVAALALVGTGIYMYRQQFSNADTETVRTAGYDAAMETIAEGYGSCSLDSLASLDGLSSEQDPLEYLVENSVFIIDSDAVRKQADSECLATETVAINSGTTYTSYVKENYDMSVDDYEDSMYAKYEEFIKERLAVYEVASEKGFEITESEYNDQLAEYAEKYGFDTVEDFEYMVDTESIAVEMLYDETVDWLYAEAGYSAL